MFLYHTRPRTQLHEVAPTAMRSPNFWRVAVKILLQFSDSEGYLQMQADSQSTRKVAERSEELSNLTIHGNEISAGISTVEQTDTEA